MSEDAPTVLLVAHWGAAPSFSCWLLGRGALDRAAILHSTSRPHAIKLAVWEGAGAGITGEWTWDRRRPR